MNRFIRTGLTWVFVIALMTRIALIVQWYTPTYANFQSGDYSLYSIGAQHLQSVGDFSNSLFLVRPPLFPLVIDVLNLNSAVILLFNALLGTLTAVLTVILAQRLDLSVPVSLAAGLIVALDPTSIVYSSFLGPEPLANVLLLLGIISLLVMMKAQSTRANLGWGGLSAGLLVLSCYTRPATYLLWIVLALWVILRNRRQWSAVLLFATLNAGGIGLWIAHNASVFGTPTFSSVGPYTMLYYRAASIERIASGQTMDQVYISINQRVESELGGDISQVDAGWREHYLAATPRVVAALQKVSLEIFTAHPLIYLYTLPVGFSRMFGVLPETSNLLPLTTNGLSIAAQVSWNVVFLLLTLNGLVLAFRQKRWLLLWCLVLLLAYYTGSTLLVKSAGMNTRERSMLAPFMATAAAYSLDAVYRSRQKRRPKQTVGT